ncbi:MAG: hypothetical protein LBH38_00435 [Holosporales bacterium]|jgi:hypothetical protein|nr:hypothetical protein [Holosporales bacterium]
MVSEKRSKDYTICSGSFRDPAGRVFDDGERIVRSVLVSYGDTWDNIVATGLFDTLLAKRFIPSFHEIEPLESSPPPT